MNREIAALAGPVREKIAASVVVDVLLTICHIGQGMCLAFWLNSLYIGRGDRLWLAAFGGTAMLRALLAWAAEVQAQTTAQTTKTWLREQLLTKLAQLGPGYAMGRHSGDLQTIIVNGVEAIEGYFSRYIPAIASAIVGCIGALAVIGLVDWPTTCILLLFLLAQPIIDMLWMRWRVPKLSGVFVASARFGAYMLDNLQGLLTLKAFDVAGRRREELAHRARLLRREAMPKISITMARIAMTSIFTSGGVAIVLVINCWRVSTNSLTPLALLLTLFLAREVFRPMERLEKEFHPAQAAKSAAKPIAELLAAEPAIKEPAVAAPSPDSSAIVFEHVSFAYKTDAFPTLYDIDFSVPQGKLIAIVGPSGAGKSTLFSLLLRFFTPQSGKIRIGGVDIAQLSSADLRAQMTMVPQDIRLFHGTIADNLRIARPDASDEDLRRVARVAQIDQFIDSLPLSYDTQVGERGAHLSGGQRQRIAIARALLKDAPILLFDEPTSNLDPAQERAIGAAMAALTAGRTTLVITHQLSTIKQADIIIVMEDGHIVEQGRHTELLAANGLYYRLSMAQMAAK